MQMVDVLKRLAELDSTNPNVAKPTMQAEQSLATVSNIENNQINECGAMMGGMEHRTPASFSINASAESGDEVSSMLRDIMNLAGVKPASDEPAFSGHNEIELGNPGEIELEPTAAPSTDGEEMGGLISMIDKMNGPSDDESISDEDPLSGDNEFSGDDNISVAQGDVDNDGDHDIHDHEAEKSPVADMADEVRDMADELADESQNISAGFDSASTTPDEKVEPHQYGNDQVTPKPNEPVKKAGGGNPYTESVNDVQARLLRDYQKFVAEGYDSRDAYEKHDPKHPDFKKNYDKYKAKNPKGTLANFIATLKKK